MAGWQGGAHSARMVAEAEMRRAADDMADAIYEWNQHGSFNNRTALLAARERYRNAQEALA